MGNSASPSDFRAVLVTGGAGFIGSNFVRHLRTGFPQLPVIVLDKLTYAGNLENLAGLLDDDRLTFVEGDICDATLVCELLPRVDAVLNFAAETHVDRSIENAGAFVQTDVYGTYVLLEAARDLGLKRFIQISTDEVYGDAGRSPSREDSPLMPRSPYAASKAGADRLAFSYWATHQVPVVITRCTNNYGPYQYPEKLIPLFITNAFEGRPMPVYGTGTNTRDWIHVEDHCRALEKVLFASGFEGEVLNIGSTRELSSLEIGRALCKIMDLPETTLQFVADRPGHVKRHAVTVDRIERELGWRASIRFEEGLERTVAWYRENEAWWKRIKSGEFREYYRRMYENRSAASGPAAR